ncbi:hypothetical protein CSB20_11510 [bacterium DOLZORAL124_64_63]|nr:MAG: hypothetical protein CSB20_11510 [bacterium DOLZORAL124_64_63]
MMMNREHDAGRATELNREGFALVTTLLVVLVLSVMAVGLVWMASSDKKVSFAEQVHVASQFSADAGGEAGINYVRLADAPPRIIDFASRTIHNQGETNVHGSQKYDYDAFYLKKTPRPGWGVDYLDYNYRIESTGSASTKGRSNVQLVVSRLYREGY